MRNIRFTGWRAILLWFAGLWIVAAIMLAIANSV